MAGGFLLFPAKETDSEGAAFETTLQYRYKKSITRKGASSPEPLGLIFRSPTGVGKGPTLFRVNRGTGELYRKGLP